MALKSIVCSRRGCTPGMLMPEDISAGWNQTEVHLLATCKARCDFCNYDIAPGDRIIALTRWRNQDCPHFGWWLRFGDPHPAAVLDAADTLASKKVLI